MPKTIILEDDECLYCDMVGHCCFVSNEDVPGLTMSFTTKLVKSVNTANDVKYKPKKHKRNVSNKVSVDLMHHMPPVWDQGKVGSCTAQSALACLYKCLPGKFIPSRYFTYYNSRLIAGYTPNEDNGCSMQDVCKSVQKYGVCPEDVWGNDKHFAEQPSREAYSIALKHRRYIYESIPKVLSIMIGCLNDGHSFFLAIEMFRSAFKKDNITHGIIPMPSPSEMREEPLGAHAITICGYDTTKQQFKMRNSWGTKWGDNGYGFIPFEYIESSLAFDAYTIRCG